MKTIEAAGRISGVNRDNDGKYHSFVSMINSDEVALVTPIVLKGVHVPIDTMVKITIEYVEAH
jgi:hypothetical protein